MKKLFGFFVMLAAILVVGPSFAGSFVAAAGEDPFGDVWQYVIPKTSIDRTVGRADIVSRARSAERAVLSSLLRVVRGSRRTVEAQAHDLSDIRRGVLSIL